MIARRTALGLLLAPLALAGCGQEDLLVTAPAADTQAYPVVESGQARSILDAVDAAVDDPIGAKETTATADARLLGPYLEIRLAEARIAAERRKKPAAEPAVTREALVVPRGTSWPRFFLAVGRSDEAATYLVRALLSQSARDPYGLWAEMMLLPGASLPVTAQDAELLDPGATGLQFTPKEAITGYAGYLNGGGRGKGASAFARSEYSDQLIQRLVADQKGLKQVATVTSKHTAVTSDGSPMAVRTQDGGALVIGEMRQTYTVTVKKGQGKVKVKDADLAALAGGKDELQFGRSFTRSAVEVVLLHVPAGDAKEQVHVIAAQKGDVKAVVK